MKAEAHKTVDRPCRLVLAKRSLVDLVNGYEVVHILHEHLYLSQYPYILYSLEYKRTVTFATFPISLPLASSTALRFVSA